MLIEFRPASTGAARVTEGLAWFVVPTDVTAGTFAERPEGVAVWVWEARLPVVKVMLSAPPA